MSSPRGRQLSLWVGVASCLVWSSAAGASNSLPERVELPETFSGVVALARAGEITTVAEGTEDAGSGKPIDASSRFWIGSLSKQFAAAAALRLVDRKQLSLEAPIHEAVAGLKPQQREGAVCTLRWVLQHRCGLPRSAGAAARGHLFDREAREELLSEVNSSRLGFAPGTRYAYSNLGYSLVGLAVQQAAGVPYEEFLRGEFWEPLDMGQTGIAWSASVAENFARAQTYVGFGFLDLQRWFLVPLSAPATLGASGNIYSTATDLLSWNAALHSGRVLSSASYSEMVAASAPEAERAEWGMGLVYERHREVEVLWHNGALEPYAYNSFLAWLPQTRTSVLVLSNRSRYLVDATKLGFSVIDGLEGKKPSLVAPELVDRLLGMLPMVLGLIALHSVFSLAAVVRRGPQKGALHWGLQVTSQSVGAALVLSIFRDTHVAVWLAIVAWVVAAASVWRWRKGLNEGVWVEKRRHAVSAGAGVALIFGVALLLFGLMHTSVLVLSYALLWGWGFWPHLRSALATRLSSG